MSFQSSILGVFKKLKTIEYQKFLSDIAVKAASANFFSDQAKKQLLIFAVLFFLTGLAYSVYQKIDVVLTLNYWPLLAIFILVTPFNIVLTSYEYWLLARRYRQSTGFRHCLETIIISLAANHLPLPGSLVVKIKGLQELGVSFKASSLIHIAISILWLGLSFMAASIAVFLITHSMAYFSVILFISLIICVPCVVLLFKAIKNIRLVVLVTVIRAFLVFTNALGLMLCFMALSSMIDMAQSLILGLSFPLARIFLFIPSGIGISELFSSILAGLIGIGTAQAFLASAIYRIVATACFLCTTMFVTKDYFNKIDKD